MMPLELKDIKKKPVDGAYIYVSVCQYSVVTSSNRISVLVYPLV
jgi:hypothetical protein